MNKESIGIYKNGDKVLLEHNSEHVSMFYDDSLTICMISLEYCIKSCTFNAAFCMDKTCNGVVSVVDSAKKTK